MASLISLRNYLLPQGTFQSTTDVNGRLTSFSSGRINDTLVQLHNRFACLLLGRQFVQSLCHFISNALHHINFVACPSATVIALLQNYTTMSANLAAQRNTQ